MVTFNTQKVVPHLGPRVGDIVFHLQCRHLSEMSNGAEEVYHPEWERVPHHAEWNTARRVRRLTSPVILYRRILLSSHRQLHQRCWPISISLCFLLAYLNMWELQPQPPISFWILGRLRVHVLPWIIWRSKGAAAALTGLCGLGQRWFVLEEDSLPSALCCGVKPRLSVLI